MHISRCSLISIDMDIEEVVWISLSLDFSSLIMFLVNYFALTATMIAFGNHWDAEYGSTGEVSQSCVGIFFCIA